MRTSSFSFLVIDDEPLVRRSLARALRARGHQTVEAVDGHEGLKAWKETHFDAVFVDVLMPGLSGPDVVRQALQAGSDAPNQNRPVVALISAFSGEDSEKLALECGADCFIPKPFEDIFVVVDSVAARVMDKMRSRE